MILLGVAMQPMIWVLVLVPPCIAILVWQGIGRGSKTEDTVPWQRVRLGKRGFWLTLAICYVAMFAAAVVLHKI
jgi:hypothetical protein